MYMGGDYDRYMDDPENNRAPGMMKSFDGFMKNEVYSSRGYKMLSAKVFSPIQQRMGLLHYVDRVSNKTLGTEKDSAIALFRALKGKMGEINDKYSITTHKGEDGVNRKGVWDSLTGDIHGDIGIYEWNTLK